MKNLIVLVALFSIAFFSCKNEKRHITIPNIAADTAQVYGPGKDTLISASVWNKLPFKKKMQTCSGETKTVTRYQYTESKDSVLVTLQGPKLTPEQLRQMFDPQPLIIPTDDDIESGASNDSQSGALDTDSSNAGVFGGIPNWFWLALILLLVAALLWWLLRKKPSEHNHTHSGALTGHLVIEDFVPYTRALQEQVKLQEEANQLNKEKLEIEKQKAVAKMEESKTHEGKIKITGLGKKNTIEITCETGGKNPDIEIEFKKANDSDSADENKVTINLKK